ncbi:MAG: type II toxin-antitoxin system VapC family toxin [Polyangiaceae bacterium]|nr:type II toxin-antitoxin system VapC family toxin [Polyangiaceae bacterium]
MQLLLDTHAFLWFVSGDPALSARARRAIEAPASTRSVSIATLWEIAIKVSIGKIALALPLAELVQVGALDNEMSLVPIAREHAIAVASLPLHHRDPIDRLLVAQALAEGLVLVSRDEAFDAYGVGRVW